MLPSDEEDAPSHRGVLPPLRSKYPASEIIRNYGGEITFATPFSLACIREHQFDLTLKRKHRFVMSLAMEQMSSGNRLVGAFGKHKANQESKANRRKCQNARPEPNATIRLDPKTRGIAFARSLFRDGLLSADGLEKVLAHD